MWIENNTTISTGLVGSQFSSRFHLLANRELWIFELIQLSFSQLLLLLLQLYCSFFHTNMKELFIRVYTVCDYFVAMRRRRRRFFCNCLAERGKRKRKNPSTFHVHQWIGIAAAIAITNCKNNNNNENWECRTEWRMMMRNDGNERRKSTKEDRAQENKTTLDESQPQKWRITPFVKGMHYSIWCALGIIKSIL